MIDKLQRRGVDISKITGPYSLLAVLLLVVEGLVTVWFIRAEGILERSFAGTVIAGVFIVFMFVVLRIGSQSSEEKPSKITPSSLEYSLAPAQKELTEAQIRTLGPELIGGPDGSYAVLAPPQGWSIKKWSLSELIADRMGITDPSFQQTLFQELPKIEGIVTIDSGKVFLGVPIPGRTKVDGRKLPTALEFPIYVRLAIIPMSRFQPPLYAERSLEQNALTLLGQMFLMFWTIRKMSTGIVVGSRRRYILFEASQKVEQAIVNGKEVDTLQYNCLVIAIEGDAQDFLLIMTYPSTIKGVLPEIAEDAKVLTRLVNSFKPLKVPDPERIRRYFAEEGEKAFSKFMSEKGEQMFMNEFFLLLARLAGLDLNLPEHRLRAINSLRPFESLADELKLEDENLKQLWDALHEAQSGDARKLKKKIAEIVEEIRD